LKYLPFIFFASILFSCVEDYPETFVDLSSYVIESGFELQVVAAEPLIEAPVDLSFDDEGRLWVLEMSGYMRSIEGVNEDDPIGRILILEDRDKDGQMDHTIIFLDSLKLARAMAHVYGGLLYAEPPNLWFIEIEDDLTPGRKQLVDPEYALGGNVEHQPNGLLYNVDNWIYNAKSNKRYRRQNGTWLIENTSFRGQWGITHDRFGRLLYNDNSNQLRGDWTYPNLLVGHPTFNAKQAIRTVIVDDQRVYPLHATVVNRGYMDGMLDEQERLKNFTSACGPLFYEGEPFPDDYQGNVFVCAPEANLIKRNIVEYQALRMTGKQAWQGKEFLAATEESFRPVNMKNGPEGALYIADMHRGVIQHKTYMTGYLRDLYVQKGLDQIVGKGRILKVLPTGFEINPSYAKSLDPEQWVDSLSSKNIWMRMRSQHLLILNDARYLEKSLVGVLNHSENQAARIHALYVLEGMQILKKEHLNIQEMALYPKLMAHILKLVADTDMLLTNKAVETLINQNDPFIDFHLAFLLSKRNNNSAVSFLTILLDRYEEADWFLEPVVIGMEDQIDLFLTSTNGYDKTKKILKKAQMDEPSAPTTVTVREDLLTRGLHLYRQHCSTCHGPDGKGLDQLAPPLLHSPYVSGNPSRLASIILFGLHGPLEINGQEYEFISPMPGIGGNEELSDQQITDITNYIRNAFTHKPDFVDIGLISSIRNSGRDFEDIYMVEELDNRFGDD
jgi:mono/diheme cytochrome c family protein